ncbi:hypothetical protein KSX_64930 [Ktedonospora formicarum]|uniref:Uncharacterized protein n=1 Tax=Ktedonospora formicarum TaxID=2778364 RepID=A0A8J3I7L6_9CHLR|nr:hypothetical protein KSX_64930 [Ktedonospora formicarum]
MQPDPKGMVLKLPPVRDGKVYHIVSRPRRRKGKEAGGALVLTRYGTCEVTRTGQAGTRCGLGRRLEDTVEGVCTVGKEEIVRGPFGGSSWRGSPVSK